jgi:hypothetical protein
VPGSELWLENGQRGWLLGPATCNIFPEYPSALLPRNQFPPSAKWSLPSRFPQSFQILGEAIFA